MSRLAAIGMLALALCALSACDSPEGRTEKFIEQSRDLQNQTRGNVAPLPQAKPREAVTPLEIERDPFARP